MLAKAVVVFCVLLPMAWAAVSFSIVTPKEGKPDECPLNDGTSLKVGERKASEKSCMQSLCDKSGDDLRLEHHSCWTMSVPKNSGCRLVTDDSKPYPECCPQPKCDGKKD